MTPSAEVQRQSKKWRIHDALRREVTPTVLGAFFFALAFALAAIAASHLAANTSDPEHVQKGAGFETCQPPC